MLTRTAVINDLHLPFHDPDVLALVLDVLEDVHIDRLVLNGDAVDFYNINSHGAKDPDVPELLEDEFNSLEKFLNEVESRITAEKVFLCGNHEYRLDRFIMKQCPEFWNMLTLENHFNFKDRGWEHHPYNTEYQLENTNLYIQHSPPSYSENGAATSLKKKPGRSYIYGCTHRMQHAKVSVSQTEQYEVFFNGWLGSTDYSHAHERVFSYLKNHENWQQCFSLVSVVDGKHFSIDQIPIKRRDGKPWCMVDGHAYFG